MTASRRHGSGAPCRRSGQVPFPLRPEVLPDAGHGFDNPRFAKAVRLPLEQAQFCFYSEASRGTTLAYSEAAGEDAAERVRAFLEEHLK